MLTVFPTGGGKSLTFQLPALISGETVKGLTIVISPLQSLMKDQVDNLRDKCISDAVTINGLLNPVERQNAIELVRNGTASILYLSPELLRSKTIENILMTRNVVRVVIDEAHCFSSWGQDFRVDYLYIGDFIKNLQEKKLDGKSIPVSCFTATAKQKVISDICEYFQKKLGLHLEKYATQATRVNLHYTVELKADDDEKYTSLRELITSKSMNDICPTIVYVSRVSDTSLLADRLTKDGIKALPYNGKMEREEKIKNQEMFISDEVGVMVATSAFGMGVDKPNVKLVVHYDISDSLENYVQEAGRAGRDQSLKAECIVYFNENDLDKHFLLLNQTKLNMAEVSQVWKAIKNIANNRNTIYISPLELARAAGWDEKKNDIETRVKTAVAALEASKYISRGLNSPRVFATSIQVKNLADGKTKMSESKLFSLEEMRTATRILKSLISSKYTYKNKDVDAESRIDYLADNLGLSKEIVIENVDKLRKAKVLADSNDMNAIFDDVERKKANQILLNYLKLERYLVKTLPDMQSRIDLKELNENAQKQGITKCNIKSIKNILLYWTVKNYIKKSRNYCDNNFEYDPQLTKDKLSEKVELRLSVVDFIINYLYDKLNSMNNEKVISFSMIELLDKYNNNNSLFNKACEYKDIQDALLYISRMGILTIEGGFLVLYNAMQIKKLVKDNKIQYKKVDYASLENFYKQKIEQIHIVGEYATMMVENYDGALEFVRDYFGMEHELFIKKYFKGDRKGEILKNITPAKYRKLFSDLSEEQRNIINDDENNIAAIAGPGSGKTTVLVRKLASLLILENVKTEQLLMLTFSRAAATEFKKRLIDQIGSSAHYVDIKTFHSFCFDLIGRNGKEEELQEAVSIATEMIDNGEVEASKIAKVVLVIDEAQDMSDKEFKLIKALSKKNPEMRIIGVGDDDQNIYEFRESNSKYLRLILSISEKSKEYELLTNYRSTKNVIKFTNSYVKRIKNRFKSNPIKGFRQEDGIVEIIKHTSSNIEEAVVKHVIANMDKGKTNAILTQTNEEAYKVLALLQKNNVCAKLIQSFDKLCLNNMMEFRYFYKLVNSSSSPIISNEIWQNAIVDLEEKYKKSINCDFIISALNIFSATNKYKYKTDLISFLCESKYEDFIDVKNEKVVVSTIHKSKGHEFDNVYMMLNNPDDKSDERKRVFYVGMTRARNNLYIHLNNDMLVNYSNYHFYRVDNTNYPEPNQLTLQLTYTDVVLSSFKDEDKKREILSLNAGDALYIADEFMCVKNLNSKKYYGFSKNFKFKLKQLKAKGYFVKNAYIRFIVAWYDKEDIEKKEYAVILPTIELSK